MTTSRSFEYCPLQAYALRSLLRYPSARTRLAGHHRVGPDAVFTDETMRLLAWRALDGWHGSQSEIQALTSAAVDPIKLMDAIASGGLPETEREALSWIDRIVERDAKATTIGALREAADRLERGEPLAETLQRLEPYVLPIWEPATHTIKQTTQPRQKDRKGAA